MNIHNRFVSSLRIKLVAILIFVMSLFFNACNKNPGDFTLGEEYIESQTDLALIDTFSVALSTVLMDTVETSGTYKMLVGNYRDDIIGKITSNSYFQIGIPGSFDVDDDATYDSLRLAIIYNSYSFGDTTANQKISVHQLTENIEFDYDDIITGETTFDYNPEPIGSIVYTPKPNGSNDTLFIKLSDAIGWDLFTKLRDNSEILTDSESFRNYFHGLVLVADEAYEGAIVGFYAYEEDVQLILYTNGLSSTEDEINYEFNMVNISKQFNNITHDFTSTQLNSLIERRDELPNSKSSGLSFLHGGIGLVLKAELPSLDEILLYDRGLIAKAQLTISPLKNSYDDFELPSSLIIYKSDKLNRISGGGSSIASSELTIDELYNEETAYTFDITDYINDEISDNYIDSEEGLLITLPLDDLQSTFERLVIDAQNHKAQFKIYYLSY